MVLNPPQNALPPPHQGTPDEDAALIDAVAGRVVRMGMAAPATFFLESTKPLSFVGSQVLVFLEPFVKSFLNLASYDRFVALMEDRRNIEKLIVRIEDLDEKARREEKERKRREKEYRQEVRKAQKRGLTKEQAEAWVRAQRGEPAAPATPAGAGPRLENGSRRGSAPGRSGTSERSKDWRRWFGRGERPRRGE